MALNYLAGVSLLFPWLYFLFLFYIFCILRTENGMCYSNCKRNTHSLDVIDTILQNIMALGNIHKLTCMHGVLAGNLFHTLWPWPWVCCTSQGDGYLWPNWHAGRTLEKTICMNMTYNYWTTIFRRILTQILCISCIIYNFSIWPWKMHKQKLKIYIFLPEICTFGRKYFYIL